MRLAVFTALCLFVVSLHAAAPDKLTVLMQQYGSDMKDLHRLQATQVDLVKQKAGIDATGADLAKRQGDLNTQADAHNAAVAAQQKALQSGKQDCGDADSNSKQNAANCASSVDSLNSKTTSLNNENLPLQTEQTNINLNYSQYNQSVNDWNLQEQQAMTAINTVYGSLNDWLDNADALIGGADFQSEIQLYHVDKDCPHHSLPGNGSITVDMLMRYTGADDKCLKAVEALRHPAHAGTSP
jgi:hypothetical protein